MSHHQPQNKHQKKNLKEHTHGVRKVGNMLNLGALRVLIEFILVNIIISVIDDLFQKWRISLKSLFQEWHQSILGDTFACMMILLTVLSHI